MCICDSKKTKAVPESMRGRTWGSLLLLFSFISCLPQFKGNLIVSKMFDIETSACTIQGWKFTGAQSVTPKT
jgi:hypothetical protein